MRKRTILASLGILAAVHGDPLPQNSKKDWRKPTPSVQKLLDQASKAVNSAPKINGLQKALNLAKRSKDLEGQAMAEDMLGQAVISPQAAPWFRASARDFRVAGDRNGEAQALMDLGYTLMVLGFPFKALEPYNQALVIGRETGQKAGEAKAMGNMGMIYASIGQNQRALEYLNHAITVLRVLGNDSEMAVLLDTAGQIDFNLGQPKKAINDFDQALTLCRKKGDPELEGGLLTNIGDAYNDLGEHQKALDYYRQSLPLFRKVKAVAAEGIALFDIGEVYIDLEEPQKALEHFNQALELSRRAGDRHNEGCVRSGLGKANLRLGKYHEALVNLTLAFPLLTASGDRVYLADTLETAARILEKQRRPAAAIVFAKQSVNTYQGLRKDILKLPKTDQESYAKRFEPTYRYLATLLIGQGRLREAEQAMNLLKEEENFEFVARDAAVTGGVEGRIEAIGGETGWWNRYQQLQDKALKLYGDEFNLTQQVSGLETRKSLTPDEKAQLSKLEVRLRELDTQKDVLDRAADAYFDEVGKKAAGLGNSVGKEAEARVSRTRDELPLLLGRIHRTAGQNVGAVYALASKTELDLLLVTYAGRAHLSISIKSEDLNRMIARIRDRVMNPDLDPRPEGERLYHLVFEKVIDRLKEAGCTRVIWCLDGTLRYIPIGALWDGKQYLIERGDFTIFDPLNLERISADANASIHAAGFAATQGKPPAFAPLPGADRELRSIVQDKSQAGFVGAVPGRAYENKAFDSSTLTSVLKGEQFTLLHLATHFNVGKDLDSSNLLLGDGNLFSLRKFAAAGSHSRLGHFDLVCLSACDTAESFGEADSAGSQFSSFVSLTLKDGASAVVASLWPVSDASTPLLMKRFYENWMAHKGKGKAEALRAAQLSLLHGDSLAPIGSSRSVASNAPSGPVDKPFIKDPKRPFAHPYYWAPFILFGNWK